MLHNTVVLALYGAVLCYIIHQSGVQTAGASWMSWVARSEVREVVLAAAHVALSYSPKPLRMKTPPATCGRYVRLASTVTRSCCCKRTQNTDTVLGMLQGMARSVIAIVWAKQGTILECTR